MREPETYVVFVSRGAEWPHKVLLIVQRDGLCAERLHRGDVPPKHRKQARDRRVVRLGALSVVSRGRQCKCAKDEEEEEKGREGVKHAAECCAV